MSSGFVDIVVGMDSHIVGGGADGLQFSAPLSPQTVEGTFVPLRRSRKTKIEYMAIGWPD